jgi:hypothetical protein
MNTDKSYTLFTPKVPKKKNKNRVRKSSLNDVSPKEWDKVTHKYVTIIKKK